jgi:hypothetical protein
MSSETNEQRMARLAQEERTMAAVAGLCQSHAAGAMSYRTAMGLLRDLIDEDTARIVRVGMEKHTPEVTT